jgi:uncharacterized protein
MSMAEIGRLNRLTIAKIGAAGAYLDTENFGSVLLPADEVPGSCAVGSDLDVFIYHDTKNRLAATTQKPSVMVDEFAWLKVVSLTNVGAFLDWGLSKDLLLPFGEQRYELQEGREVLVRVFVDQHTQRIAATTRVDDYLQDESAEFKAGQAVDLLITGQTEMGFKAIVDNSHWGVLYSNELFQPLARGQRLGGFIKKIRDDKRIDLTLNEPGYGKIAKVCEQIITALKEHDGFIMMTDKSSPEAVYSVFKVSKKVYKKAVGALYKQRRIAIEKQGIRLLE